MCGCFMHSHFLFSLDVKMFIPLSLFRHYNNRFRPLKHCATHNDVLFFPCSQSLSFRDSGRNPCTLQPQPHRRWGKSLLPLRKHLHLPCLPWCFAFGMFPYTTQLTYPHRYICSFYVLAFLVSSSVNNVSEHIKNHFPEINLNQL